MYLDTVSTKALGIDIEYSLRSNALSAKSILGGRVALTPRNDLLNPRPLYFLTIPTLLDELPQMVGDPNSVIGHYFCLNFRPFLLRFTFLTPPFLLYAYLDYVHSPYALMLSRSRTDDKNTI